jgi:PAS domain S-box-containing protein
MLGAMTDITKIKKAEAELRDRGNQLDVLYGLASTVNRADSLQLIYDKALDAILTTLRADRASILLFDEQGVMQFQAWRGLSETYRRAVTGHSPWKRGETGMTPIVIEDVAASGIDSALKTVILEEDIQAMAFVPLTSSGRIIGKFMVYFERPWKLAEEDLGVAQGIADLLGTGIERKRAEQALRESEERLRLAIEAAEIGTWDLNCLTGENRWDRRCKALFGFPPEAHVEYKTFLAVLHPNDRARVLETIQRSVHPSSDGSYDIEYRIVTTDGREKWIRAMGRAFFEEREGERQPVRFMGTALDVTERKRSEQAALEAQDRLQRWSVELEQAVNVKTAELRQSHDRLRTMATELNLSEQRERKRLATDLHDHLQQMLVVGKLKLGQGKRVAEASPKAAKLMKETDDVLSEALKYTRTLVTELSPPVLRDHGLPTGLKWLGKYMEKHQIAVTVIVPEKDELALPEDQAVLLFQSVRELLINSSKYAGTGQATVSLEQRDGLLRIEVRDEGVGFDFAAAAAGTPSGGISSKFGLFSIRERMRALDGSFEIHSVPGQGTTATLLLPLGRNGEVEGKVTAADLKNSTLTSTLPPPAYRIRVLLVDDHIMVRQGLRTVLDTYADVKLIGEAGNGEEAVQLVDQLRPEVVVMDINMPKMDGIQATEQIMIRYPETIVIGLSVNAATENEEAMKRAGAVGLMTKEAAVEQLYGAIQEAVRSVARTR